MCSSDLVTGLGMAPQAFNHVIRMLAPGPGFTHTAVALFFLLAQRLAPGGFFGHAPFDAPLFIFFHRSFQAI